MPNLRQPGISFIIKQFKAGKSLGRAYMNTCLKDLELVGPILDLGAGQVGTSSYHGIIPHFRAFQVMSVDLSAEKRPTKVGDIQCGIPFENEAFATCLAFNLFEHLYEFDAVLHEIWRVLKPDGRLYMSIPFLKRVHADPCDYFRYTHYALERSLSHVGFGEILITPFGGGAVTAALAQIDFIVPRILRGLFLRSSLVADYFITKRSGGQYRNATDYPLGYFIETGKYRVHQGG